mgnify:CR=1 FL=1
MEIMTIVKLFPVVLTIVETIKRFLPNKTRNMANPIMAVVTGIIGAYMYGGQEEVINILLQGLLAGGAAIGAYKLPKMAGVKLGIE